MAHTRYSRLRVGLIVISLYVRILHGFVEAANDWFDVERGVLLSEGSREDITRRYLDGLQKQVVLKHDKSSIQGGCVAHNVLPVLHDLLWGYGSGGNVEVCVRFHNKSKITDIDTIH
jgi:hypothetical protein